jgi:hypothetical protein
MAWIMCCYRMAPIISQALRAGGCLIHATRYVFFRIILLSGVACGGL